MLASLAGGVVGYLLLYAALYAAVRYDAPDGAAGTFLGYLLLALPLFGLGLGALVHRRLRSAGWLALLLVAVVTVVLLPHPVSVDCGSSISGYTCPGLIND